MAWNGWITSYRGRVHASIAWNLISDIQFGKIGTDLAANNAKQIWTSSDERKGQEVDVSGRKQKL